MKRIKLVIEEVYDNYNMLDEAFDIHYEHDSLFEFPLRQSMNKIVTRNSNKTNPKKRWNDCKYSNKHPRSYLRNLMFTKGKHVDWVRSKFYKKFKSPNDRYIFNEFIDYEIRKEHVDIKHPSWFDGSCPFIDYDGLISYDHDKCKRNRCRIYDYENDVYLWNCIIGSGQHKKIVKFNKRYVRKLKKLRNSNNKEFDKSLKDHNKKVNRENRDIRSSKTVYNLSLLESFFSLKHMSDFDKFARIYYNKFQ